MIIGFRCLAFTALLLVFFASPTQAQSLFAEPNNNYQHSKSLSSALKQWEVYRVDAPALSAAVKNKAIPEITLGNHIWRFQLSSSGILSPDYTLQVVTPSGTVVQRMTEEIAFQGYETNGGGKMRLTLTDDFIYGYITEGDKTWYVEPLWYYEPAAAPDLFVVYEYKDVIPNSDATCAVREMEEKKEHFQREENPENTPETISACYQLDLAIASDKSMYTKYMSSVTNVQNHNIGVINNVQGDYNGEFNHDIQFNIVTQVVISGTDPWSNTTDAGDLLDEFRDWGNSGGFGMQFDLGEMWTNRNFDGSTVGVAWLNAVCTSLRYHLLQDFTSNSQQLRCMTSHEIGHNFSCDHDLETGSSCPPNFIMCPFVSTSSTWSTTSRNEVNSYLVGLINNGCLSACSGGGGTPPTANFNWSPNPSCQSQTIQFTDMSTGTVSSRSWTFQGGTPASSTQLNPTAIWNTAGTYNVTLTVTGNGGSNSVTKQVVIAPKPTADFTFSVDGNTVSFTNTSVNANTYLWNFGNGVTSTDINPVFTYLTSGLYSVTLTATNNCGSSTRINAVRTAPTANFIASTQSGCAPLTVQFVNQSTGSTITSYNWLFQGGTPASSAIASPSIVYNSPGSFDVSLTVGNVSGTNTLLREDFIVVLASPVAGFEWAANNLNVQFTNTSTNATGYSWDFGDGNFSTETEPIHNYESGGAYTVILTVSGNCGVRTFTRLIELEDAPVPGFSAGITNGCGPLSVSFNNESSENADSFEWLFPGGTPASSTAASPTVVYSTPGTYSVSLTATNALGSSTLTEQNYITVNAPPTPAFNSSSSGLTASFTNTSANAVSYLWNFGDGSNTSTAVNPDHTYAADGVYTVTLTATNTCGTSTSTQTVTIITPPTADFSANQTAGCAPLSVTFENESSSNASSFQWQFPGGSPATSTLSNPVVVYATPGMYSATLIAVNAAGADTSVQNNIITVNGGPTAAFGANVAGAVATFSNTSANAVSYLWNFGDGSNTSTAVNPGHTYAADGVYTVTLTATNPCGTSTSTQTVTIVTPPTADFAASQTAGCAPLSVTFGNESSSNAGSFQWQFPGGSPASSTQSNPVVVYATPGMYSATLIAVNAAGADTSVQNNIITVNGGPTAAFGANVAGAVATFSNTSANAVSYLWNFGDGSNTSTAVNPGHTYAADGVYTVTLTATNACGTSTSTQTVTIITPPTANFSAGQTTGCGPLTVSFTNMSSSNATSFQWEFPGGSPSSSTAANPVVTYTTQGTYPVTLIAFNTAGNNTFQQTNFITVLPLPTASFTAIVDGTHVSFNKNSANSESFFWDFGDPDGAGNNTSTEANPTHTYTRDGAYTVTLTASNNCGATVFSQIVTIVTPPNALFSVIEDGACAPASIQFQNASSENSSSFLWTFEGGQPATSTLPNPVVVWSQPGIHTVTLTASNTAGSHTSTDAVTITGPPEAGFSSLTAGLSVVTNNTTTGATSYHWNFGDPASGMADTSTLVAPVHPFSSVGTYLVTLIAENLCGADTFTTEVVIAGDAPQSAFSTGDGTIFCAPAAVQYQDQSAGNPDSWFWEFPGGDPATSTEQSPVVMYLQPGSYSATLTSGNIYGTDTATVENAVSIGHAPASLFEVNTNGSEVFLDNLSTDADTYLWYLGDGNTSTLEYPNHMYAQSDTYNIVLITANECGADTFALTVFLAVTDAPEVAAWNMFRLFPNPNFGQFTLEMSGTPQDRLEFVLFNTLGQQLVLETADFSTGTLQYNFDYRYLPAALYTLRVRSGKQSRFVKIAIQR